MHATTTLNELHQEEPTVPEPRQTPEQASSTAIAFLEEPVIDGEVTAIIEPLPPPAPKQRPYYLIVIGTVLACLLFTGLSLLVPLVSPSATVTIIPREEHISIIGAIPIHARLLPALTLSQSTTVPATGKRHQIATRAEGTITFYNGLFTSQSVAAGTRLTGNDGVQIITDQPASIPAGNPPVYGQVTVSAHAVSVGASGNIQAFDINEACCLTSVLAKNTEAFTGGTEARDYIVVTHHDIDAAAGILTTTLAKSERAALRAQVNPGEALIIQSCSKQIISDHQPGEEATEVHLSVSETCNAFAYILRDFHQYARQLLTKQAMRRFGTGYSLFGDLHVRIIQATIRDQESRIATIMVKLDAIYDYQLSPGEKLHLVRLIAGKSKEQAVKALFQLPGIQGASINSTERTLPEDLGRIKIIVLDRVV